MRVGIVVVKALGGFAEDGRGVLTQRWLRAWRQTRKSRVERGLGLSEAAEKVGSFKVGHVYGEGVVTPSLTKSSTIAASARASIVQGAALRSRLRSASIR